MITLTSCPNCSSKNTNKYTVVPGASLIAEITPGVKVNAAVITRYDQCLNCNLIFQNPRLSDKELGIYYGSGYYRRTINAPSEGMDKAERDRADTNFELIKQYVGDVESHLDIGCGLGYLLEKVGANIKVGVESDTGYVKFKDIKVYPKLNQVTPKKFDLVTSIHVLEHVPYPALYLKSMTKYVKSDGYLVIEVPSAKTNGGPLGIAHLSYFEPDVLRLMCREVGLKIIDTKFTPHLLLICKR